jgi:hypothetical protein
MSALCGKVDYSRPPKALRGVGRSLRCRGISWRPSHCAGPPHGKPPHPMPYLKGLREVNAEPNLSVAFEDSRSGISLPALQVLRLWEYGRVLACRYGRSRCTPDRLTLLMTRN